MAKQARKTSTSVGSLCASTATSFFTCVAGPGGGGGQGHKGHLRALWGGVYNIKAGTGRRRRHTTLPPARAESQGSPWGCHSCLCPRTPPRGSPWGYHGCLCPPPPPNPGRLAFHVRLPSGAVLTLTQKSRVMKETATRRRRKKRRNHAVQSSQLLSPIIRTYSWGCTGTAALAPRRLPGPQSASATPRLPWPIQPCPQPHGADVTETN